MENLATWLLVCKTWCFSLKMNAQAETSEKISEGWINTKFAYERNHESMQNTLPAVLSTAQRWKVRLLNYICRQISSEIKEWREFFNSHFSEIILSLTMRWKYPVYSWKKPVT